jgi:hypothetical protein
MGAPYNNIDTKVEAALAEVISDAITAGTLSLTDYGVLRTGIDDEIKEENCIICLVESAEEEIARSGIWAVQCTVTVYTNMDAAAALANHKSNVAKVRDLFMDDALDTTLTATDESVLVSGITSYKINNSTEERFAVGDVTFGIIAAAT